MLEGGESRDSIMRTLGCDSRFIARWSGRFLSERLSGMYARHPGRAPKQPPARVEARVLNRTLKHKPADGSTHWSSYKLAAELGAMSVSAVQRIWRKRGIKPQQPRLSCKLDCNLVIFGACVHRISCCARLFIIVDQSPLLNSIRRSFAATRSPA